MIQPIEEDRGEAYRRGLPNRVRPIPQRDFVGKRGDRWISRPQAQDKHRRSGTPRPLVYGAERVQRVARMSQATEPITSNNIQPNPASNESVGGTSGSRIENS